ncbi:ATP-binding protein [Planctomycetota bacterium]
MILIRGLLAPFVALTLVCAILVYYFASYLRDQVEATLVRTASNHRHLVDAFLRERACDLRFAAASCSIEEISNQANLTELFRNLQTGSEAFFDLGVFDDTGNHLEYVGPYDLAGRNYAEAEWFEAVREEGLYISDVFLGYRKIPHFIIAVRRREGDRTWYLRATIDTLSFNGLVEGIRMGQTGEAYVVNRKGILQTTRRSGGKLMESDPDFNTYVIDDDNVTSFSAGQRSQQRYLYATGPLRRVDWVLVVRQGVGDAYGPVTRAVVIAVAVILIGGTVAGFMAYILASGVANTLAMANMEKQHIKTQLIIAGKLAEVGEMSAGLAHEINNPLQVMQSELTMIEDVLGDMEGDEHPADTHKLALIKDSLDQFRVQIARCGRITKGLLNFARKTEPSLKPVKMQEFLPEVISMVESRANVDNVRITQEFAHDLPPIVTDSSQLQQVFLNLLNNALFALQDADSAEIRVKAFQEDQNLVVSVEDNGCGIPPENMEKIFVPLFTTKPPGQGTGLGLSSIYGIVKGFGGDVTVTSEPSAGAVFAVSLPLESPRARSSTS